MALFSRRKKSEPASDPQESEAPVEVAPIEEVPDAPAVNISVQAFRGMGAEAGRAVSLETDAAQAAPTAPAGSAAPAASDRPLPLAPLTPPEQKHSVVGMNDNILLRDALARLPEKPTNEQLLGVLRQALQGHLILRVHGDAQAQLDASEPLQVSVVRDGERSFLLAFSSGEALRRVLAHEGEKAGTSAVGQPVTGIIHQVLSGGFTGLIVDNASAPHRAVFPAEVLKKAIDDADPKMAIKAVLAAPRESETEARLAELLTETRVWIAAGTQPNGQVGIAEAKTPDGKRYLQLFTHPLEVMALGRGERPLPFPPDQLGRVLTGEPALAGVLLDPAGPTMVVRREALGAVMALAASEPAGDAANDAS